MAQVKFTQLPNLGQMTANTIVPVVDSNLNYTVTAAAIQNYALNGNSAASLAGNIATDAYFVGDGSQIANLANNAALTGFSNSIIQTNSNVSNVYASVVGIQANAVATNSNVANLVTAVNSTNSNVANTNANVAAISSNTSGLTSNVATLQTQTASLTGAVANTNSNVATLTISTTGITANVNSLTSSLTNTNYNVAFNTTNISILQGNVTSLTGKVYTNANVAAYLPTYGGNLQTGNALILGNLQVNGTTTTVNSNTVTINDLAINVANNAVVASQANGGGLLIGPLGAEYAGITYDSTTNALVTSGALSITGLIYGNGSQLTGLPASYGNAQVAAYLPTNTANVATGNLILPTNGRILGDFGNAATNSRTMFQNNGNSYTVFGILPGAGYTSSVSRLGAINIFANTDLTNTSFLATQMFANRALISSNAVGTGTLVPLTIGTGNNLITFTGVNWTSITGNVILPSTNQVIQSNGIIRGNNLIISNVTVSNNVSVLQNISLAGNVISDKSLLSIDSVSTAGTVYGFTGLFTSASAVGLQAQNLAVTNEVTFNKITTTANTVTLGNGAGQFNQSQGAIAIGDFAVNLNQGQYAIAIGANVGNNQANNSIALNATSANLFATTANAMYVKPVRGDSTANLVANGFKGIYYNPTTGEFAYTTS